MSVKIIGQVWDLDLPHRKQSIMLAMADHADHEGNNVYPSIGLVAWKTGYSINQARRIIQELVDDGLLILVDERKGTSKKYRIDLSKGVPKKPYKPTPPKMVDHPSHLDGRPTPPIAMGVESSLEPPINHQSANADSRTPESKTSDVSPKTKPRHWTFETIALECFALQRDQIQGKGGHIGIIVYGTKRGEGELGIMQLVYGKDTKITEEMDWNLAEELAHMFQAYRIKNPTLNVPTGSGTIWKALVDYRASLVQSPVPAQPKARNPDGTFVDGSPFEPFQSWPSGKWITEPIRHATPDYSVTTRVTNRLQPAQVIDPIDPNDIDLDTF